MQPAPQQYPPPQYYAVPAQPQPQPQPQAAPEGRSDARHVLNVATQAVTCACCTPLAWCCVYLCLGADWCGEGEPECPPPQAPPVPMGQVVVPASPQPAPQAAPAVALGLDRGGLVSIPVMLRR